MIISDLRIFEEIEKGSIVIRPFLQALDARNLMQASGLHLRRDAYSSIDLF